MIAFLRRQPTWLLAVVLGTLSALFSVTGSWIPSYWGDEAASVMSAQRPLASLEPMLERVDAVHGFFYVILHFWIKVFGASPFAVRSLSALCVGLAAAGIVVLLSIFRHRTVAVLAAVTFAVLPRVTYMGVEARSYAMSAACATWLTVLFVWLVRHTLRKASAPEKSRRVSWQSLDLWAWLLYVAGFVLSIHVFLYLVLLLPVHAIVLFSQTRRWRVLLTWLTSAVLILALSLSFIREAMAEHKQIAFLAHRAPIDLGNIAVTQWFSHWWIALAAWPLILIGLGLPALQRLRAYRSGQKPFTQELMMPSLVLLSAAWLFIPTGLLWLLNVFTPVYADRYLSFATPAIGIAIALGLSHIRWLWLKIALVAAFIALIIPGYLSQRTPYAKNNGTDWNSVSELISLDSQPGDAILFDPTERNSRKPRLAEHLYPEQFSKVTDVALAIPYAQRAWLWDSAAPLSSLGTPLASVNRVWVVEGTLNSTWGLKELEAMGFHQVRKIPVNISVVYEYER